MSICSFLVLITEIPPVPFVSSVNSCKKKKRGMMSWFMCLTGRVHLRLVINPLPCRVLVVYLQQESWKPTRIQRHDSCLAGDSSWNNIHPLSPLTGHLQLRWYRTKADPDPTCSQWTVDDQKFFILSKTILPVGRQPVIRKPESKTDTETFLVTSELGSSLSSSPATDWWCQCLPRTIESL